MSTAAVVRRVVLFAALEQIAKNNTSRDLLVDDSKNKVDLTIKGSVKSFEVKESFAGQLLVGAALIATCKRSAIRSASSIEISAWATPG